MNRIDKKFRELRNKKKKAFIVYLTVGYPDISTTEKLVMELNKIGVDLFELGMPFSDPLADGPVIQEASTFALKHKINLESVFSLTQRLRKRINAPLVTMGYFNPILNYGIDRFAKNAKISGLDGAIVPDLPIEESTELRKSLNKNNLYLIDFITPTTDLTRIKRISKLSKGFIYYISLTGVTGARDSLPKETTKRLNYLKKFIRIPICVGFGLSKRSQFKAVSRLCDGSIVGSAVIKKIKQNIGRKDLVCKVANFTRNLIP
ncbi:MAG: tryptophan synthase subunit alpha [Candidatus Omnitrophota bacterium]